MAFIQNFGGGDVAVGLMLFLFTLAYGFLIVVPFWRIFKRIGWPPPLSLLALVPGAVIVMLYLVAFGEWNTPERTRRTLLSRSEGRL